MDDREAFKLFDSLALVAVALLTKQMYVIKLIFGNQKKRPERWSRSTALRDILVRQRKGNLK